MRKLLFKLTVAVSLVSGAACTTSQTPVPGVTGPSEQGTSLRVTASPDSVTQDGASQSLIFVKAFAADGRPLAGLPVRVDMSVGGTLQDYGTLSARTIVTDSGGSASTVYTAPPPPPAAAAGSPTTVLIVATATKSDSLDAARQTTGIRLVPAGVILPPASTPTAKFTVTPTPVNLNVTTTFDASLSCGTPLDSSGNCPITQFGSQIVSYAWTFGDGGVGNGKVVTHSFTTVSTFDVTLTVTNDRGVSATTTQQITTTVSAAPTGDWTVSPVAPVVGDQVQFNASGVQAAPGHRITQYSWDFGDPTSPSNSSGQMIATHQYNAVGTYTVVLTVRDDVGQQLTTTHTVTVASGQPKVGFTFAVTNPATHTIQVDGSQSVAAGTATITSYAWSWGDGSSTAGGAAAIALHSYAAAGSYTVTLTATDSLGRVGTFSQTVAVP